MSVLENLEIWSYIVRDRAERERGLEQVFSMFPVFK